MARTSSNSSTKSQDLPSPLSTVVNAEGEFESRRLGVGQSDPDIQRIVRSRPIAIELPPRRRSGQTNTPTPPEPLSARGDLLGGYFPLHEDCQRSYKTHPFDNYSLSKSNFTTTIMPASPQYTPMGHSIVDQPHKPRVPPLTEPPLMQMPLGKYHPSVYKQVNIPEKLAVKVAASQGPTPTTQPTQSKHHRKNSDVKRKVQKYQRDMVEQAALAGRMQILGMKPISPRLLPLNSPGPVTPMELEERTEYMSAAAVDGLGSNGTAKERRFSS